MFFSRIKRLRLLMREMKEKADEAMLRYADFLEPGVWKSSEDLVFLYKKGYRKKQKNEGRFLTRLSPGYLSLDGTERLSRSLFAKTYRFKKKTPALPDAGQVLAFTSKNKTVKVINSEKHSFLTVYDTVERLQDYLNKRNLWACTFPVPAILNVDPERRYINEELLQKEQFSPEQAFEQVLVDYKRFFESIGKESVQGSISEENAKKLLEISEKAGLREIGRRALSYMRSEGYRVNLNHGDLNYPNLVYSNGTFYYIDFETVGKRWFFCDLLYYIAKNHVRLGSNLLQKYLNGAFDEAFSEIFKYNGAEYHPEDRTVYLFVMEMLVSYFGKFPLFIKYPEIWQDAKDQ